MPIGLAEHTGIAFRASENGPLPVRRLTMGAMLRIIKPDSNVNIVDFFSIV
jgi:hypothetical protein